MVVGQTIINDEGQLKLAGGEKQGPAQPYNPYATIAVPMMAYDLATGADEELCETPKLVNPQAAAKDGTILLYDPTGPTVIRVQGGKATKLDDALPTFFLAEKGEPEINAWGEAAYYARRAILAPTSEGFVLVGPPTADGSSDTYVLRDDADAFESYEKRSSDDRVYSQAACAYRGRLFVIGSAWFEPEQRFFRATAMDVPEYPGDIPCDDPTPSPEPEPEPTPTPTSTKTSAATPQTGDPLPPASVTAMVAVAGLALVAGGVALRKRQSQV